MAVEGTVTPPTETPAPAPPSTPAPTSSTAAPTGTAPVNAGAPQPPAQKPEPPQYRFDQVISQRDGFKTKATTLEAENTRLKQQIAQTLGIPSGQVSDARTEGIKEELLKIFPQLKTLGGLSDEQLQQLLQTPGQVAQTNDFVQRGYQKHANQVVKDIVGKVNEALGSDLSDRATKNLRSAFASFIEEEAIRSQQQGGPTDTFQKYLDGDEGLIEAFAKEWVDDYVEPAKRRATAQAAQRTNVRVPDSKGRGQMTQVVKPQKFESWDDRLDYAAKLAKERGVAFGNQ